MVFCTPKERESRIGTLKSCEAPRYFLSGRWQWERPAGASAADILLRKACTDFVWNWYVCSWLNFNGGISFQSKFSPIRRTSFFGTDCSRVCSRCADPDGDGNYKNLVLCSHCESVVHQHNEQARAALKYSSRKPTRRNAKHQEDERRVTRRKGHNNPSRPAFSPLAWRAVSRSPPPMSPLASVVGSPDRRPCPPAISPLAFVVGAQILAPGRRPCPPAIAPHAFVVGAQILAPGRRPSRPSIAPHAFVVGARTFASVWRPSS